MTKYSQLNVVEPFREIGYTYTHLVHCLDDSEMSSTQISSQY